ncbi:MULTISPECIES: rhodanese-like domain-containing protein [Flavobacterium]|jgi:phage shock protein E|uniref:Rhodanese-related sulfurtransferase n=2 Tax=Flavobacterium TaxID=237 RepID=A0A1M5QAY6_9FLAO|nr:MULTISPECIES: rhodanese-like domain-containing protein [Flavobacterium]PRZ22128.1 rhodanese-related sulfurtransferase [Flavobacterium granuli]RBN49407.1 rhodanese-like domain-containing protein [Flavobacterium psychrolimnae]SHH10663.1 Rhodanese-related sulfurtransferase [Flavobacterium granuli]
MNLVKKGILFFIIIFISNFIAAQNTPNVLTQTLSQKAKTTELKRVLKKRPFLVDVRTPEEFAQGTVKGAVNIPLDQIQNQLSKFKGKKNIVVFCRTGNRSTQAKAILEQNGFTNITNGGTWQDVNAIINK